MQAFGPNSTQDDVFDHAAKPIVDAVLDGYNGTIFAYGQTGSGKTFTMEGSEESPGIMPRVFEYIAAHIAANSVGCQFVVYLSFLEIYNEEIVDLLIKGKVQVPFSFVEMISCLLTVVDRRGPSPNCHPLGWRQA